MDIRITGGGTGRDLPNIRQLIQQQVSALHSTRRMEIGRSRWVHCCC